MPLVENYLVEKKEYARDSLKILFKMYIMSKHADIVRFFRSASFGKTIQCSVALKGFVVTTGMVETGYGYYQNTIGFAFGDSKQAITEYSGDQYPPKLTEDQYLARLIFELKGLHQVYQATFVADLLEIEPKPANEQIVKEIIESLKKLLAEEPKIFLQSAKTKFSCGILDFLGGRYRAVPHNVYYATYDLIRCLSIWSGMQVPEDFHGHKAQKRLMEILDLLVLGQHKQFKKSKVNYFKSLDKKRYERLVIDLYEMRQLADYQMHFEMGEFVPLLSSLMLKVEELFTLASYVQDGSIAYHRDNTYVSIWQGNRELEPLEGSSYLDRLNGHMLVASKTGHYNILERGLILADRFDRKLLQSEILKRDDIFFSPFSPSQAGLDFSVKFEKGDKTSWKYSGMIGSKPEEEEGYVQFNAENVRKISDIVKKDEIDELQKEEDSENEVYFTDGKYFFVFEVLPDGRFYYFSPLATGEVAEQIASMAKIRDIIARIVSTKWKHKSTVSFSSFSIIP
jgi:hypothetical protein